MAFEELDSPPESNVPSVEPDAAKQAIPGRRFPVVGVGASAGGLDAFTKLLSHLPPRPGMAFLFVQHLDPHRDSLLPELLTSVSPMPVRQIENGMELQPDQVYVSPSNASVTVVDSHLRLSPRPETPRLFMPVDFMLRSLARSRSARAIGVILSGGGTDGALGIQAIKEAEGITFAQDDESAAHDSMPRSAVLTGCVDYVLDPAGIAQELARIGGHPYLATRADPVKQDAVDDLDEADLQKIFGLIRDASGVDFGRYKRSTIMRRVRRRMTLKRLDHVTEYIGLLQKERDELSALYQDFLIRVTSFFRDAEAFDFLRAKIFPDLIRNRSNETPVRVWVAGCSTGEEVYSLAIALTESLAQVSSSVPIKILATDVNERALEIARRGLYIENIAADVSQERLRRFFSRVDGCYQISKKIRDLCVFSRHDLTRDPPFARLDVITCRNLLIYLNLAVQRRVLPLFHYALRPAGYLMLGPSETIGTFGELFAPVSAEFKVFARKLTASTPHLDFMMSEPAKSYGLSLSDRRNEVPEGEPVGFRLKREVDHLLLAQYAPVGVVIDDDMKILQFRGQTDAYLAPAPGVASFDLLKMAREGLMVDLRAAVDQARLGHEPVERESVRIDRKGPNLSVRIHVVPLRPVADGGRFYLVLFEPKEVRARANLAPEQSVGAQRAAVPDQIDESAARQQASELRRELDATREYLQAIIEENEATTEEVKAANEEILSSNEELQSTNEELQTAKEEMQSANEELSTVNDELNYRNLELARVNDDLINLFSCLNIPIVMVSRDLRIRRFTTPAERLMNLIATDLGRPIGDIRTNFDLPDLDRRITTVIDTLAPEDLELPDREGHWYSVRIRPYITVDNKIDGAVLAIVDIDHLKRTSEQLEHARDRAVEIVETVWQPLIVLDAGLRVMRANRAFHQLFGKLRAPVEGTPLADLRPGPWSDPSFLTDLHNLPEVGAPLSPREIEAEIGSMGRRSLQVYACLIKWDDSGGEPMILLAMEDITERKRETDRKQQLLREQAARFEAERANRRKDEFLAMLAHELRNPLAPILNSLLVLRAHEAKPDDVDWALKILERQVRYLSRLIEDLLDASRVMRGSILLRRERIELAPAVSHALEVVRSVIEGRRHHLTVNPPTEPIMLDADPVRVEQILVNLLHNAAKYTPEEGEISLTYGREGDQAVIRVVDNGIGIAREHIHEVFDLFMQVDNSLERSLGGLGIGLTLVKSLAELHGGTVEAHSPGVGKGSEFVVRLPALPVGDSAALGNSETTAPAGPLRILIVDDNQDSRESLARLLESMGHEPQIAATGERAIEIARDFHPAIALLDIGLPVMNGFELARRLRAEPEQKNLTIVAVSGYGKDEDSMRAREVGFDDYAVKPITLDRLNQILAQVRQR